MMCIYMNYILCSLSETDCDLVLNIPLMFVNLFKYCIFMPIAVMHNGGLAALHGPGSFTVEKYAMRL